MFINRLLQEDDTNVLNMSQFNINLRYLAESQGKD